MAVSGKDKVERWFYIFWDDSTPTARNLTADLVPGTVSGGGLTLDEVEMTGVSNAVKNYLAGHANSEISAQFYINDTATTGSLTVLMGTEGTVGTLTLQWGGGGAPTTDDPEWAGEYTLLSADIVLAGNKHVIACRWLPGTATAPAWGTV